MLERLRDGRGSAAMVEGEGGIGKTRLVQEIADEAAGLGFEVYVGRAEELERSRPFAAASHALGAFRRQIDDIVWAEPLGTGRYAVAEMAGTHARSAEAMVDLLEERALRSPTLVCIEDLHWADPATLLFARVVTRRLGAFPLGLIVTFRPPQDLPDLAALVDRFATEGVPLHRLGPLAPDDVAEVVEQALRAVPGPQLREEVARAAGNPFYVLELISALEEEGAIVRTENSVELHGSVIPPSLRLTILRRLSVLPSDAFDDLRMASIVGSTFDVEDLLLLVDKGVDELFRSLEPARRAGFLREQGERLAFRHDLVHAALYEDIPAALRRSLHRRLAEAMGAAGRSITAVATHMSMGASPEDLQAYAWLALAARCLGAANVALAFLQRAIEVAPPGAPLLDHVRVQEAQSLSVLGGERSVDAELLARELQASAASPEVRYEAGGVLALALIHQGRLPEVVQQLRLLVDEQSAPVVARAEHLTHLGQSLGWLGDMEGAEQAATKALDLAGQEPTVRSFASMLLSYVATSRGDVGASIRHGQEAFRHSREHPYRPGDPPYGLAGALGFLSADEPDRAEQLARDGVREAERIGIVYSAVYQRALAGIRYATGKWDDALVDARSSVQVGDEPPMGRLGAYAIPARIHLHRGELDAAREIIAAGEDELGRGDLIAADLLFWAKAKLLEYEGDDTGALEVLERVWLLTSSVRYMFGMWRLIWPDLVKLAMAQARSELVDEVVRAGRVGAERAGHIVPAQAASMRIEGVARGDASLLGEAARLCQASKLLVERTMADEDAGLEFARAKQTEEASAFLIRALEGYESLGASLDAGRVQAALRSIGVRRGSRGTRQRPMTGWDALTPTELRIVPLVAEGLTNARIGERLFVSRRTVETHLRNIFGKLGVSSRTELAAVSARHTADR